MANLIVICGPQAVGKMTVAESLRDKLRYTINAPVHAPHTSPLRMPLPKQEPSLNACSSVMPHSSEKAARID